MGNAVDTKGKSYNRWLLIIVLLVGTFFTVLNQTILSTAFPTLMNAFNVSTATVQWLTTGFMLVNGIMIPISAWLSTRFNTKWLYIVAMSIFFVGTLVSYTAPTSNFGILLTGRILQGIGVGVTMPLLQTIMLSVFPPERRGTAMGLAGIVIGVAPAIGPTLSGWVIDSFTWRDLFGMSLPFLALVIIASFFWMHQFWKRKRKVSMFFQLSSQLLGSVVYSTASHQLVTMAGAVPRLSVS